uniref:PDZ domain-containing protein n=1 Tax=Heterorhabditis bacteriophora TaxID=37862 RepID=A0A1I7XIC9_HETBA
MQYGDVENIVSFIPGYYELTANPMDVIKFHCPKKRTEEFSLIYKVSLEEFQRCSLSKDAELIASCNNDRHSVVVRHILRQVHSESGHNYYISTSTGHLNGLENRRLGLCNEKNMRLAVHLSKRELIPQHDTALEGVNVDLQRLMQEKFYLAEENGELNWKKNVLPEVEFDWKEYMERHGKKMESVHIEPIPLNDEFVSRWEEMKEIRIRDLSLGTKFPNVNAIRVERVEVSEDKNIFENITFIIDIDYTGGFETSIDVTTVFGKRANLSIKITKLAGLVRFILSRQPYNHWTFSFVSAPTFETEISSQIQGHQLKRLIPLIKESIRRALQRKHVWPNYKIRYRPVFPNPLLQASPPLSSFAHVKLEGGLEVTVLQCSRLQTALVEKDTANYEVYCTITMGDTLVAINNVPIRSERQVVRFLQQTIGDLFVLVDRNLDNIDDYGLKEDIIGDLCGNSDETFESNETVEPQLRKQECSPLESHRRHSMSIVPLDPSVIDTNTESINSSLMSLDGHRLEDQGVSFRWLCSYYFFSSCCGICMHHFAYGV